MSDSSILGVTFEGRRMLPEDAQTRLALLAYGVLVILAPVVILTLTLGFLILSGDLVLGRLTPLEFLELYLIELVVFVGFGYGLYRLTLWASEHRLPTLIDALESEGDPEGQTGDDDSGEGSE